MTRNQQLLSLMALVQLILIAVVFWPRNTDVVEAQPLLVDFSADSATTLIVEDGDGNRSELTRSDTGWAVVDTDQFSADIGRITTLLTALETLHVGSVVAETANSHARLKVAAGEFNRKITIVRGSTEDVILIGSQASGSTTHIRHAASDAVYLTSDLSAFEVNAAVENWIETTYVNQNQDNIARVRLTNTNGSFEFARDTAGNWASVTGLEGNELDPSQVNVLLGRFASARMVRPLGKTAQQAYGLDRPQATLQVQLADGNEVTFLVGAQNEAGEYYAKYSASDFYVTLAAFTVQQMVTFSAENFSLPSASEAIDN